MPVYERGVAVLTSQSRGYLICSATPSEYRALKLYRDGHLFVVSDQVTTLSQDQPLCKIKLRNCDLADGKVACVSGSREGDRLELRWNSQLWLVDQFDPEVGPRSRPVNGVLEEPAWSTNSEPQDYLSASKSYFSPQIDPPAVPVPASEDQQAEAQAHEPEPVKSESPAEVTAIRTDRFPETSFNLPHGDESSQNGHSHSQENKHSIENNNGNREVYEHQERPRTPINRGNSSHQSSRPSLSPHYSSHTKVPSPTNREGRPECLKCGETFYTATGLEKHLARFNCSSRPSSSDQRSQTPQQSRRYSVSTSERNPRPQSPQRPRDNIERSTNSPYGSRPASNDSGNYSNSARHEPQRRRTPKRGKGRR